MDGESDVRLDARDDRAGEPAAIVIPWSGSNDMLLRDERALRQSRSAAKRTRAGSLMR
jgi:hypothetical protein